MAEAARSALHLGVIPRLIVLAGLAFALTAGEASAATIVVDSTADIAPSAGMCVLRDAIAAGNNDVSVNGCAAGDSSGPDVIQFAPGVTGTIALQAALPQISGQLTIDGPGAGQLDIHRAVGAPAFRVIVTAGVTTISGVTISNGLVQAATASHTTTGLFFGGGVRNTGTLTLDRVTVTGNRLEGSSAPGFAPITVHGGGIASSGPSLTISHSRIVGNTVSATAAQSDSFTEVNATAVGGAIFASNPQISIDHTTISGNTAEAASTGGRDNAQSRAAAFGGGLATGLGAFATLTTPADTLTIDASTISSNTADSAHPDGSYVLQKDRADGGGVILGLGGVEVRLTASTVASNVADSSGGLHLSQGNVLTVADSTLAGNSAASAANLGREPGANSSGDLTGTIVANPLGGGGNCAAGAVTSSGHNLEGPDPLGPPTCGFSDPSDLVGVDPKLGPLMDNGGPTETMALSPASPALDVGTSAAPASDQRGLTRPADLGIAANGPWGDGTDIGAFELQPSEAQRRLSVSVKGAGSVTSSSGGIACGASCAASYYYGAVVTLTGHPGATSRPARWTGCASIDSSGRCVVGMTAARNVVATFDPVPPPDTRISKTTVKSAKRKATINFAGSGGVGALSFACSLDGKPFKSCASPLTLRKLSPGKHAFRVKSVDGSGRSDPTPAATSFRLKR